MPGKGLSLLCLDGGGIRGLSSLFALRRLMEAVAQEKGWEEAPKPCEFFDMIGGTSTGGIIAIMLGRLEMSIDDCVSAYIKLSAKVFVKKHYLPVTISGQVQARFDSAALRACVQECIKECGLDENMLLKKSEDTQCKVFVVATNATTSKPVTLTSYQTKRTDSDRLKHVKLWQAALATSAASTFFDAVKIPMGVYSESYVDGGAGANNPIYQLWNEARDVWMKDSDKLEDHIDCLVTIGTGIPSIKPFGESLKEVAESLVRISTETEETAEEFRRAHANLFLKGRCCRLNVNGLQDVGLEEKDKIELIIQATKNYLQSQEVLDMMEKSVQCLAEHEYDQRGLIRRDDWTLAASDEQHIIYSRVQTISTYNHALAHRILGRKRIPGTGRWLLSHSIFEQWAANAKSSLLVCTGIVGSGKTMLAYVSNRDFGRKELISVARTLLVEHLLGQIGIAESGVVYYYFEKAYSQHLSALTMLRSFIKQLLLHPRPLARYRMQKLRELIDAFFSPQALPLHELDLLDLMVSLLEGLSCLTCVIDGLNELPDEEADAVCEIIKQLLETSCRSCIKIALFSRDQFGGFAVRKKFSSHLSLELDLALLEKDIVTFVNISVDRKMIEDRHLTTDTYVLDSIKKRLIQEGSKMFLWIHLQILSIWRRCTNDEEIENALQCLPDGLDATYVQCLEQIDCHEISRRYAPSIFMWLVLAERPLRSIEMQEAMSLEAMDTHWNTSKIARVPPQDCCANLVEYDERSHVLRFVHPSVKQFLTTGVPSHLSRYGVDLEVDQLVVGGLCIRYLNLPMFGLALEQAQSPGSLDARRVTDHLVADWPIAETAMSMLYPRSQRTSSLNVRIYPTRKAPTVRPYDERFSFFLYARRYWLQHNLNIQSTSPVWNEFRHLVLTPNPILGLQPWALSQMSRSKYLENMFRFGIESGHVALIGLTLDSSDYMSLKLDLPNSRIAGRGQYPLHLAAAFDKPKVLSFLLPHVKTIDTADDTGATAVHAAAMLERPDCARLLCSAGASLIWHDAKESPMCAAILRGKHATLQAMLGFSPDDTLKVPRFAEILSDLAFLAVIEQQSECLLCLLEKGVDISVKDELGLSLLHIAVLKANTNIIGLLVARGADVNALDSQQRTPLHHAVVLNIRDSLAVCKSLFQAENCATYYVASFKICVSINSSPLGLVLFMYLSAWSLSASSLAVERQLTAIRRFFSDVQHLVDYTIPQYYEQPMAEIELLELLVSRKYNDPSGVLHKANAKWEKLLEVIFRSLPPSTVASLVHCGALFHHRDDEFSRAVLRLSLLHENLLLLKHLSQSKVISRACLADIDQHGRKILHVTVISGNDCMLELLLSDNDVKATINLTDQQLRSPLHLATQFGYESMIRMLLEGGALLDQADVNGQTPLHLACIRGISSIRSMLVHAGADPNARDGSGSLPYEHVVNSQKFWSLPYWRNAKTMDVDLSCLYGPSIDPAMSLPSQLQGRTDHLHELGLDLDCLPTFQIVPPNKIIVATLPRLNSYIDTETFAVTSPPSIELASNQAEANLQAALRSSLRRQVSSREPNESTSVTRTGQRQVFGFSRTSSTDSGLTPAKSSRTIPGLDDTTGDSFAPAPPPKVSDTLPRSKLLSKDYWMRDELARDCFHCGERFTTFRRKHHCRTCGQIFDHNCTSIIPGALFGSTNSIRVCKACEIILTNGDDDSSDNSIEEIT